MLYQVELQFGGHDRVQPHVVKGLQGPAQHVAWVEGVGRAIKPAQLHQALGGRLAGPGKSTYSGTSPLMFSSVVPPQ